MNIFYKHCLIVFIVKYCPIGRVFLKNLLKTDNSDTCTMLMEIILASLLLTFNMHRPHLFSWIFQKYLLQRVYWGLCQISMIQYFCNIDVLEGPKYASLVDLPKVYVNPLSAIPTKGSNILKELADCFRRIISVCFIILWGWRLKS